MAGALCAKSPSLNASWTSLASLQADPWAAYLTAVYRDLGALPFPFSLTSLSFFYQDLLPAGVLLGGRHLLPPFLSPELPAVRHREPTRR